MDPLSITVATIAIIQTINKTYHAIQHLKGLPGAFKEVGRELPLVNETLELACVQLRATALDEPTKKAIDVVIRGCRDKATALNNIFQELQNHSQSDKDPKDGPMKDWSALVNFYRMAVLRLGKAHRVEALMQGLLSGLRRLVEHQLFRTATATQVEKIDTAIKKLAEVERLEPSLPDSEFEGGASTSFSQMIADQGTGYQFTAMGGTQTVHLGTAFNSSGPMSFGTDFMNMLMKKGH